MFNSLDKNYSFTLLGAGRPFKNTREEVTNSQINMVVLDWLMAAAGQVTKTINFVGGYNIDKVKEKYPDLIYTFNQNWEETKATGSFLAANLSDCEAAIVSYTDIIYREKALLELAKIDADIVVAVDANWEWRFKDRAASDLSKAEKVIVSEGSVRQIGRGVSVSGATSEFIGLTKISKRVLDYLKTLSEGDIEDLKILPFSDFIEKLRLSGFEVHAYDVLGEWAELNDPRDIGQFILGTKAETLMRFQNMLKKSVVLDQISFRVADWELDQNAIVEQIKDKFSGNSIIIRSSALSEDNFDTAGAGVYESRGDVDSGNTSDIISAVEFVIASYIDGSHDNQVMVQQMLRGVGASGVVFTRALSTAAPYYVINYDDETKSTDSITGGSARTSKTCKISRVYDAINCLSAPLKQIVEAVKEVESLIGLDGLDIEFAIGDDGVLYLFQVRPLIKNAEIPTAVDHAIFEAIETAKINFDGLAKAPPHILGEKSIFGSMPDWNPAEIIGVHPGRLAADLYADLILDDIWARQRAEYGYRNVRPQKLMRLFCGQPYIDVRASFNSFIPAELPDSLAGRLVDFYLHCLAQNPQAHDKVEFEILPTCCDLHFVHWQNTLRENGFSNEDISIYEEALRKLTCRAISQPHGAADKLQLLQERFTAVSNTDLQPVRKACLLLEEAKELGTLPFSHLARDGFVAVTLLKSGVAAGVITQAAVADFMKGLNSITGQLAEDAAAVSGGQMDATDFIDKYGHLRPDTYNIASPCYREKSELVLEPLLAKASEAHITKEPSHIWDEQKYIFFDRLIADGIGESASHLESFLISAIEGREYAKFLFSRNLSAALDLFAQLGVSLGFERGELADLPLAYFKQLDVDGNEQAFSKAARQWLDMNEQESRAHSMVELPELLLSSVDFDFFSLSPNSGNFIGENKVTASCVHYTGELKDADFTGKLVLIESADPGYDWLFGAGIAGLITKFGGANSHMAIRSAEFGLPAAIGLGEVRFNELITAETLQLDCQSKTIRRIS